MSARVPVVAPDATSGQRRAERLTLGSAAILSLRQAAALLPIGDAEGRRWLRNHGLVRNLAGREVVIWEDITNALRAEAEAPDAAPVEPRRPLGRTPL